MSNRLKLLRDGAIRPRRTVPILLDGEVREQVEAVEDALDRLDPADAKVTDRRLATKRNNAEITKLQAELDSLREQAQASTLYVVLEGMQRTPYRALIAQHPPRTGEDGKVLPVDRFGCNTETAQEPLVRACLVGYREQPTADSPVLHMPAEDVDRLMQFVTDRQMEFLSVAAFAVCRGDDAVPLPRRRSATTTPAAG